ncbi:MAG: tRNA pseudouridine(55) synthase TruB [Synergistaceae bacterium]|jgi:tRNA pseudouridine(55) synthase|nr:tRNA pseudouridine(55) synthase TruB [Synergistaceae bacterium]
MFQGLISIDKPVGLRSSYCVEQLKKIIDKRTKIGHGGTLDSSASGVLVMLLGGATRLSDLVMRMPKIYRAVLRLGCETSTCDYTGDMTETGNHERVAETDIDGLIPSFLGWRMQTPPEVSAVHVGGRRAHEIFRSGVAPDIKPRPVFIESIVRAGGISRDGRVELSIRCGKGAYVRAIARDMGRALGCGAHIASLRREAVGFFSLAGSLTWREKPSDMKDELISSIQPIESMDRFIPCYTVNDSGAERLANGMGIPPLSLVSRESDGVKCPESAVMIRSASLVSLGRIETTCRGVAIMPEINIKLEPRETETAI